MYFLLQLVFNRKRALIWRADILIDIYRAISDKSQLETKKSRFQVNCYLNVCSEPVNKLLITDRSKKIVVRVKVGLVVGIYPKNVLAVFTIDISFINTSYSVLL